MDEANGQQITNTILMVRPAHFGFNEQTAANNVFQCNDTSLSSLEIQAKALTEFNEFVDKLRNAGVVVHVVDDTDQPVKIDAIFPNNWISFHRNGTVVTYPMFSDIRRQERREDIVHLISNKYNFKNRLRFERFEAEGRYLEGTGSMILDRVNKIVYACTSPRTDGQVLDEFARATGYRAMLFKACDDQGREIYHTNVMMALGTSFVVICLEAVAPETRESLLKLLQGTGKEVIHISLAQMKEFAGNMLQIRGRNDSTYLVMSERAYNCLNGDQIESIKKHTEILHTPLNTIENYGGGSARCMLAEVFVPE